MKLKKNKQNFKVKKLFTDSENIKTEINEKSFLLQNQRQSIRVLNEQTKEAESFRASQGLVDKAEKTIGSLTEFLTVGNLRSILTHDEILCLSVEL